MEPITTKNIPEENFLKSKIRLCVFIFLFFAAFDQSAQNSSKTKTPDKYKVNVIADRVVNLEFTADKAIGNLLVVLSDNFGNTLFMDCQYNFKGLYKRTMDLSSYGKGDYHLKIVTDEEEVNKKLNIQ